jgi:hypothetical protein
MKLPFARDTAALIDKTRAAIAGLELDLEQLTETRGRRLLDGEAGELLQIERTVTDKQRELGLQRDKLVAIEAALVKAIATSGSKSSWMRLPG